VAGAAWEMLCGERSVENAAMNIVKYKHSAALETVAEIPFTTNEFFPHDAVVHALFSLGT
jgi:hypothetical protein